MKRSYDLEVEWKPFELHPEIPPQGIKLDPSRFGDSSGGLGERIRAMAEESGLPYRRPPIIANSHLALAATEHAKDRGAVEEFHRRVFAAYYGEGRNVGDLRVLREIAVACGLDDVEMTAALREGRYEERLAASRQEAEEAGYISVPTFLFADRVPVVGAQSYDVFEHTVRRMIARGLDGRNGTR